MELDKSRLPRHVAIIMDGNGRWAKQRNLPRAAGHRAGTERLRGIVRKSSEWGVEALTVYAFSTENWKRPRAEIEALMELLREYFVKELDELHQNHVRVRLLGSLEGLRPGIRGLLERAMEQTAANGGLRFNIAFNYGGRAEIARAARLLAQEAQSGALRPEDIGEETVMARLYTAGEADVDLLIRTGGEKRLSNFLPLQTAYAELCFSDLHWPDFSDEAYAQALSDFARRQRRYGGVEQA